MSASYIYDQPGSVQTADGAHLNMVQIRQLLLGAGLQQVAVAGGYDATETGTSAQVPAVVNTYSAPMWFSFTDDLQAVYPVFVRVEVGWGWYWRTSAGSERYPVRVTIADSMAMDGFVATFGGLNAISTSTPYYAMSRAARGSFCRYTGTALTLIHGVDGIKPNSISAFYSTVFVHFMRDADGRIAIVSQPDWAGGVVPGPFLTKWRNGNTVTVSTDGFDRSGGSLTFYINSIPSASPALAINNKNGEVEPIPGVFSLPGPYEDHGQILWLDFTGELKPYLVIAPELSSHFAGYSEQKINLLFEWEA